MIFNPHYNLRDKHAFLGASNYHWLNYTDDKLKDAYLNHRAKELGTKKHKFAKDAIELKIKLPKTSKTLDHYVNDAIGFNMIPEQPLYVNDICFGTADAIHFNEKTMVLRIHDLKTGKTPASMAQLRIYAAMFCLEYKYSPNDLKKIILRIYQNDDVVEEIAEPTTIMYIMDQIKYKSEYITNLELEG